MNEIELYTHAKQWAIGHRKATALDAHNYATWYVENYPDGDKEHSKAFSYWEDPTPA